MRGGKRPPVALTLKTEGTSGKPPAKKTVTFKLDAPTITVHLPTSPPVTSQPSQPTTTTRPTDEATIKWGKKLGGLDDGAIARLAK